ncbi:MAG: hypothetical protein NTY37_11875, partial [Methanothrix sp.]|nr:hypothetical protein [Methanothrix sp.]
MAEGTQDIQGLREVPASEILAKIEKGEPVDYDHIIIKGDLIIKTLDLPKDKDNFFVSSSIRIDNSSFDGIADFSNLIIIKPIQFYITSFFKGATFNDSKFMCFADFRGTRFCGGSAFMNTHFCGSLFFDDVNFLHQATFWDARFDCDVNF